LSLTLAKATYSHIFTKKYYQAQGVVGGSTGSAKACQHLSQSLLAGI
jgi:hypothetical protein